MNDIAQTICVTVAATWLGAIGIGIITIGIRLNNAVQKLAVVVDHLGRQVARNRSDVRELRREHGTHAERISILEHKP